MFHYWFISNNEEYFHSSSLKYRLLLNNGNLYSKVQIDNTWETFLIAENVSEFEIRYEG